MYVVNYGGTFGLGGKKYAKVVDAYKSAMASVKGGLVSGNGDIKIIDSKTGKIVVRVPCKRG